MQDATRAVRVKAAMDEIENLTQNSPERVGEVLSGLQRLLAVLEKRQNGSPGTILKDRRDAMKKVQGFDMKSSAPYLYFASQGWLDITFEETVLMARVVCGHLHVALDRNASRTREHYFKWLSDYWTVFSGPFSGLSVIYADEVAQSQAAQVAGDQVAAGEAAADQMAAAED
jgi:hypothetical protein